MRSQKVTNAEPSENEVGVQWSLKDWTIFVPTLTTGLALAWEVGRLKPIGGFQFFSISDHLVAAAPALPYAFLAATLLAATAWVVSLAGRPLRKRSRIISASLLGVLAVLAMSTIALSFIREIPFSYTILAAIVILSAFQISLLSPPSRNLQLVLAFCFAVLLAAVWASDLTVFRLKRAESREFEATITAKSGVFKAYVIMSGERGLLIYAWPTRQLSFVRADEIVRVDWTHSPGRALNRSGRE